MKGRDVIAQAQSGTGKTATFSCAILQSIDTTVRETQVYFVLSNKVFRFKNFHVPLNRKIKTLNAKKWQRNLHRLGFSDPAKMLKKYFCWI